MSSIDVYSLARTTLGEQSVGKSFALNHLVDTSFAMSAMRTTDGVWMSVTPTEDSLIVALDFEGKFCFTRRCYGLIWYKLGVHSIERSVQEDSLMVLFNTAISNLVRPLFSHAFTKAEKLLTVGYISEQFRVIPGHWWSFPVISVIGHSLGPQHEPNVIQVDTLHRDQGSIFPHCIAFAQSNFARLGCH